MDARRYQQLLAAVRIGGAAYVRNLAAAEMAIYQGQFNVAKILRAVGHAQRVLAMNAARILQPEIAASGLLATNLSEIVGGEGVAAGEGLSGDVNLDEAVVVRYFERTEVVRNQAEAILRKGIQSLTEHPDVLERDVHLFVHGCSDCGYLVEGERPERCELCGAPAVVFNWFGPYYAATPEKLGRVLPDEVLAILRATPGELALAVEGVSDAVLLRKPTPDEWSVKELIGHLIETDRLCLQVIDEIMAAGEQMAQHKPHGAPWKMHEGKGYEQMGTAELLARFQSSRAEVVEQLQSITFRDWSRAGSYPGAAISVMDRGRWIANHDIGHMVHIRRQVGQWMSGE